MSTSSFSRRRRGYGTSLIFEAALRRFDLVLAVSEAGRETSVEERRRKLRLVADCMVAGFFDGRDIDYIGPIPKLPWQTLSDAEREQAISWAVEAVVEGRSSWAASSLSFHFIEEWKRVAWTSSTPDQGLMWPQGVRFSYSDKITASQWPYLNKFVMDSDFSSSQLVSLLNDYSDILDKGQAPALDNLLDRVCERLEENAFFGYTEKDAIRYVQTFSKLLGLWKEEHERVVYEDALFNDDHILHLLREQSTITFCGRQTQDGKNDYVPYLDYKGTEHLPYGYKQALVGKWEYEKKRNKKICSVCAGHEHEVPGLEEKAQYFAEESMQQCRVAARKAAVEFLCNESSQYSEYGISRVMSRRWHDAFIQVADQTFLKYLKSVPEHERLKIILEEDAYLTLKRKIAKRKKKQVVLDDEWLTNFVSKWDLGLGQSWAYWDVWIRSGLSKREVPQWFIEKYGADYTGQFRLKLHAPTHDYR